MKVYLFLDEEGYCTGWGSNEEVNSVPYELNNEVILNGIMKYRYHEGVLIYDEKKALINAKENRIYKAKNQLTNSLVKGFVVNLKGEDYKYVYDEENKAYLNKVNDLAKSGLIDGATFKFVKNDQEVSVFVEIANIDELWLLSFIHEEGCQKVYSEYIKQVNEAKSLAQLQKIKYGEEELING